MKKFLICIIIMITLTGCIQKTELRDRAIVQCFGVDFDSEKFRICLQIFSSSGEGSESTDKNSHVVISEGKTITQAMCNLNNILGKSLFLGNNRVILIGEETAKNGISDIIGFFNSDYQTGIRTDIAVCSGSAENFIKSRSDSLISSKNIETAIYQSRIHGLTGESTLLSAEKALNSKTEGSFLLAYMKEKEENGRILPIINGNALFRSDKMILILDDYLSEGAAWIYGKGEIICINSQNENKEEFSVIAQKPSLKIKTDFKNDNRKIILEVKFNGSMAEILQGKSSGITVDELKKTEKICEKYVKNQIEAVSEKCIFEEKCDIFDFGNSLSSKEKSEIFTDNRLNGNFELEIRVDCHLERPVLEAENSV